MEHDTHWLVQRRDDDGRWQPRIDLRYRRVDYNWWAHDTEEAAREFLRHQTHGLEYRIVRIDRAITSTVTVVGGVPHRLADPD